MTDLIDFFPFPTHEIPTTSSSTSTITSTTSEVTSLITPSTASSSEERITSTTTYVTYTQIPTTTHSDSSSSSISSSFVPVQTGNSNSDNKNGAIGKNTSMIITIAILVSTTLIISALITFCVRKRLRLTKRTKRSTDFFRHLSPRNSSIFNTYRRNSNSHNAVYDEKRNSTMFERNMKSRINNTARPSTNEENISNTLATTPRRALARNDYNQSNLYQNFQRFNEPIQQVVPPTPQPAIISSTYHHHPSSQMSHNQQLQPPPNLSQTLIVPTTYQQHNLNPVSNFPPPSSFPPPRANSFTPPSYNVNGAPPSTNQHYNHNSNNMFVSDGGNSINASGYNNNYNNDNSLKNGFGSSSFQQRR